MFNFKSFLKEDYQLQYHDKLNPDLWEPDGSLKKDVKDKLLQIANEFRQWCNVSSSQVYDIIFTGSNANYNYVSGVSDIDIHIILRFESIIPGASKDFVSDYLYDKKVIWTDRHLGIRVRGNPVELFYQAWDEYQAYINQNSYNRGVYSLMTDKWLFKPTYNPPNLSDPIFIKKLNHAVDRINRMIELKQYDKLVQFKKKLIASRSITLQNQGEFGNDNLVYKALRGQGMLDKINNFLLKHQDEILSL